MNRLLPGLVVFMAACTSPSGGDTRNDPTPTPAAWDLTVDDVTATTDVSVGGQILVNISLSNSGTEANAGTRLQFSDLDDHADIVGCVPECTVDKFLGTFADLPGVPAGGTADFRVEFIATDVGAARWTVCIYDGPGGDQIYCGEGTTLIH